MKQKIQKDDIRYWTYRNYIIGLDKLLRSLYPADEDLVKTVANSKAFRKLSLCKNSDRAQLEKMLRQSWFTELALWKTGSYPDLLPYAAPWLMVQSYYAVYSMARSYFLAAARDVHAHHETTWKTIGADLVSCKDRFPWPWSTVLEGDPFASPLGLINAPPLWSLNLRTVLTSPLQVDPWQHYIMFLKTTRQRQISRQIDKWKTSKKRHRITKRERAEIALAHRPTIVFDLLYRMRTRSNYHDIDSFTNNLASPFHHAELHHALCDIVHLSLMLFELLITPLTGKKWLDSVVSDISSPSIWQPAQTTIIARWQTTKKQL